MKTLFYSEFQNLEFYFKLKNWFYKINLWRIKPIKLKFIKNKDMLIFLKLSTIIKI